MLETNKYARNPFFVDAVQVTPANMSAVAEWCNGPILKQDEGLVSESNYIKVRVHRPLTEKQTKAFVGDWVLYAGTGFKVYPDRAFKKNFSQVGDGTTIYDGRAANSDDDTPTVEHTVWRDAVTGEFVDRQYAEANPDTTVSETIETRIKNESDAQPVAGGLTDVDPLLPVSPGGVDPNVKLEDLQDEEIQDEVEQVVEQLPADEADEELPVPEDVKDQVEKEQSEYVGETEAEHTKLPEDADPS